jgi:hypothetical protein
MPNYQLGKIYKIVDNTNNNIYIGSTCEPTLARRLAKHVSSYKQYLAGKIKHYTKSFDIIANGDYYIVLIESYSCESNDELLAREKFWSNEIDCINKNKNQGLWLTLGKKEYQKQYDAKYRENHKEDIKIKKKLYGQKNKDKINSRRGAHYLCECGMQYSLGHRARHYKSKKHQDYLYKQKFISGIIKCDSLEKLFKYMNQK